MELITKSEFLKLLNNLKKELNLKITGYIQLNITFKNYRTNFSNDICTIIESNSNNSISFNFNEIQNIQKEENTIVIYLDNEINTKIEIQL